MAFEQLAVYLFLGTMLLGVLVGMLDMIGASMYDLSAIKRQKLWLANPTAKRFRWRPLISVLVPARDEAAVIERCLESLVKSSYRKYEIVVIDDASTDSTKAIVKRFMAAHPKKKIQLLSRRKQTGKGGALNAGFRTRAKGDLIMVLDADSTVQKHSLRQAARHFIMDERVSALAANVRAMPHPSIIGLLQQFEYLTSFRSKKFFTLASAEYIVGGTGAVYRREIFKKLKGFNESMWTEDIAFSLSVASLGNKQFRLVYASDVIVHTEPVASYRGLFQQRYRWKLGSLQALFHHRKLFFSSSKLHTKLLGWFRLPLAIWSEIMLLIEPFMLTYFIYLAIVFNYPLLFVISWAAVTVYLTFVVWTDEYLPLKDRLRFSFFIPMMFSVFYVMTFVQVIAMLKCLMNIKKITNLDAPKASWRSPRRLAI